MVSIEGRTFVPQTEIGVQPLPFGRNNEVVICPEVRLTPRRIEVLTLTAQGFSREQIAEKLSLHINTIDHHRRRIQDAFGTDGIFFSIIKAVNMGILDVSELTKDMDEQELEKLSTRELRVLESLANGNNHEEIARSLYIGRSTVTRDLSSTRKKLGLKKNPQNELSNPNLPIILLYMDAKKRDALPPEEYGNLTYKQKRILKLIVSGYFTKQISEELNITMTSLHYFHHQMFKFFDISTFTELLIKLVDMKIIDPHKYIKDVKKADNNFLKNVDTADISSLLTKINANERNILNALVSNSTGGKTNKEIANSLNIHPNIVEKHIHSISKKLGKARRGHIAMWYLAATALPTPQLASPGSGQYPASQGETLQE